MIHHLDDTMAYTACKLLHFAVETSANRDVVTCPRCLAPEDAEGCRLLYGHQILMPNGEAAIVAEAVGWPVPEVLVILRGMRVRIPAGEVVLL